MENEKLENGIYSGFRTFGRAEEFAKQHGSNRYLVVWSQAESCYVVIIDDH